MTDLPAHSRLGASGAERWMECPGSVALFNTLAIDTESDDPDYRVDGTTAHAGAAWCLESGTEAWEIVGSGFDGNEFTAEMADSVQVYLDVCRSYVTDTSEMFVEFRVYDPAVHEAFYGTVDCCIIDGHQMFVIDYKHGKGIAVSIKGNPQTRYYANGMLRHPAAKDVTVVTRIIVQPRIPYHPEGPVRREEDSAEFLRGWLEKTLVPAMKRAEEDRGLSPGPHCRFCPAKLVCPAVSAAFLAMSTADPTTPHDMTDEQLDLEHNLTESVKFYARAVEAEMLRRALRGSSFSTAKLVNKQSTRVFRDGAEDRFTAEFGEKAYSKPVLLSPPQMEKLGGDARVLVKEWAYTPDTGFTMAPMTDNRAPVKVQPTSQVFTKFLQTLEDE